MTKKVPDIAVKLRSDQWETVTEGLRRVEERQRRILALERDRLSATDLMSHRIALRAIVVARFAIELELLDDPMPYPFPNRRKI